MEGDPILIERRGPVLGVALNRPAASNALNPAMLRALSLAWRDAANPGVRAVVLTANGRNFCAGADLRDRPDQQHQVHDLRHAFHPMLLALAALDKPVVAALNGAAAGGGMALALAADIRLASPDARFVPAWASIGLPPDLGTSWFLPRIVGAARVFAWTASSAPLDAEKALAWGLVQEIVEAGQLAAQAWALAERLATVPGAALRETKRLLRDSARHSLAEQLEAEAVAVAAASADPERTAAMETARERFGLG
ncbi:MAG: enoyl-CoA hydratase-related protein [Candidatus Sphingomonas phytovorans]|nr:enoyl-CoA hydratase-related protein [Sphingomonas sp.]WEK02223.1 MAG: enoyl-CoA hydratase-related protein [Sphingomonas sp.]